MGLIKFTLFAILFSLINSVHAQNFEIIGNEVTQVNNSLNDAFFLNDSVGFAVGGYGFGSGVIIKTIDYGNSWERTDVNHNLFSLIFLSDSIGYAVGESSTIMKTIDGGESWSYLNVEIIAPSFQCRTVAFLNPDTGFVGTANGPGYAFLYTHNGGETWNNSEPSSVYGRAKLQKVNDSTVYSLPYDNKFYKSTDYGESWEAIFLPVNTGSARDMHFFNIDSGIVSIREFSSNCGSNYYLAKTYNGGESWTNQNHPCTDFKGLEFPNNNVGYSIGTYFSDSIRTFWRTIDSGDTWEELEYPVGEIYFGVSCMATSISCVNQDTCYMPTNYGTIIKMTNASGGLVSVVDNNSITANQLLVYPNPNNGKFIVKLPKDVGLDSGQITIYGSNAQVVYKEKIRTETNELVISKKELANGLYFFNIMIGTDFYNGKFVKY